MMNNTKIRQILKTCILVMSDDGVGGMEAVVTVKKDNISFLENGRNLTELFNNINKQLKNL